MSREIDPDEVHREPSLKIRFDSLSQSDGARSIVFEGLREEVVCREVDEVIPALRRLDAAVADGLHAAGMVAYEAAPAMDPALAVRPPAAADLPLLHFGIFARRVEGAPLEGLAEREGYRLESPVPSLTAAAYAERIERIQRLIEAGDTYQVNFTFPMHAEFAGSAAALYRDLCRSQTAGYCALIELDGGAIVSASPELFFRREGGRIELRPMKGTRPRGRWAAEDERLRAELAASAKDRAENLMIVDLLRNDLGRVARTGTVRVPELYRIERYPTVHQMISVVTGEVPEGVGNADLFRALFPSGSVTGAPKIRTTEIIRELENGPRGVYTGAVGFMSSDLTSFNVAIRTPVVDVGAGSLTLGVGSGITTDSEAGAEYRECLEKAAFLTRRRPLFRLLESLRLEVPGGYPLLDRHLHRISRSAEYFGFAFDAVHARMRLLALERDSEPGVYKVRMRASEAGALEIESVPIVDADAPIAIRLATKPVDSGDPFLFHKTTNRGVYERAMRGAGNAEEAILYNERGELTEGTRFNLVLEMDGDLLTPPREAGLLAGTRRAEELASGRIREARLGVEDLERADRIYLINSVRGWREAVRID